MGIIRKVTVGVTVGTAAALGYIRTSTSIISPIPLNDPLYGSSSYKKYNVHHNAATNDICVKTIPLSRIRPELRQKEGELALEFCRGVWSSWGESLSKLSSLFYSSLACINTQEHCSGIGNIANESIGYEIQRRYLHRKWYSPETSSQLWTRDQLAASAYEPGSQVTDHFEVVERTPSEIIIRCGDSPRNQGPRPSDGLFAIGATIDHDAQVAHLTLKSCFFRTDSKIDSDKGPMPSWIENLHQWYARIWMVSGSRRVMR